LANSLIIAEALTEAAKKSLDHRQPLATICQALPLER
jgi:hypothetical protein